MALQTSGKISMADITAEFKVPNNTPLSKLYRGGGIVTSNNIKVPTSGAIKLSDFYGAQSAIHVVVNITADVAHLDTKVLAANNGYDESLGIPLSLEINIMPNIVVYSSNPDWSAMWVQKHIEGSSIVINNRGYIVGMGGYGGSSWGDGGNGGNALTVESAVTINNTGTIGGGGGGGGGVGNQGGVGGSGGRTGRVNSPNGSSNGGPWGNEGTFAAAGAGVALYGSYGKPSSMVSGSGGNWGEKGQNGLEIDRWGNVRSERLGGAGGKSIVGKQFVSFTNQGTIMGEQV